MKDVYDDKTMSHANHSLKSHVDDWLKQLKNEVISTHGISVSNELVFHITSSFEQLIRELQTLSEDS